MVPIYVNTDLLIAIMAAPAGRVVAAGKEATDGVAGAADAEEEGDEMGWLAVIEIYRGQGTAE